MSDHYTLCQESARYLADQGAGECELGLVLGSGLDGIVGSLESARAIPYDRIPHFPASTVDFHAGRMLFGELAGRRVAIMEGRLHYYEGHSMQAVVHPIRTLWALGVKTLVLTSAVGGLNPAYPKGAVVAVRDHINLMGDNPLIGPNDERIGPRFPDMSAPYSDELRGLLRAAAARNGLELHEGVLAGVAGPNLETAAEYRFLSRVGADLVGMSMVPENLAAVHAGLEVLGLAVVTDLCDPDQLEPVDVPEILRVAAEAQPRLQALILGFLAELDNRKGVEA